MMSAEDNPARTIRPRLDAAGAIIDRVKLIRGTTVNDQATGQPAQTLLSLQRDLGLIRDTLRSTKDARIFVIDPVSAFLGDVDSHKNAEVRQMLAPLCEMANDTDVSMLIVSHFNKASGSAAIYRTTGSLAFPAAARAAWAVVKDEDDPDQRKFVNIKNNIAKDIGGLRFRIVGDPVGRVQWEGEIQQNADQAMSNGGGNGNGRGRPSRERSAARDWLEELLANGPVPVTRIQEEAKAAGFAWRTVQRAQGESGAQSYRDGFTWNWRLRPATAPEEPQPTVEESL